MRYVTIDKAEPDMVLAKPIFDDATRILLTVGSRLTSEYITRLGNRGYQGFYIMDSLSKGIDIPDTIPVELRNRGVNAVKSGNIDGGLSIAQDIVDEIVRNRKVTLDMVDLRTFDDYTFRHSVNVSVLATVIGMRLKIDKKRLERLCFGALFHDVGKSQIDPLVLNKPARLNSDEFQIIKHHPKMSYQILKDKGLIDEEVLDGVLHHHENEDGSGYPDGLEKHSISLFAKIIHVADVYDALTSKRPYKEPYSPSEAVEYLMGGCTILFDEGIVKAFIKSVPIYPKGTDVILSDGEQGIVYENTVNPVRPKIKIMPGFIVNLNDNEKFFNITIHPATLVENNFSVSMGVNRVGTQMKKKILLIEADGETVIQVHDTLDERYQVENVTSGAEAIKYLQVHPMPDMLILEVELPDESGVTLAQVIREKISPSVPMIFITRKADRATVLRCKELRASDFIIKPFRPVYVLDRVEEILS